MKERIIRRADQLQRKWQETEFPGGQMDFGDTEKKPEVQAGSIYKQEPAQKKLFNQIDATNVGPSQGLTMESPKEESARKQESEDDIEWVSMKGASILRKLYYWGKQEGHFKKEELAVIYWVAQCIERKKKPSLRDAREVRRLYKRAVTRGFSIA